MTDQNGAGRTQPPAGGRRRHRRAWGGALTIVTAAIAVTLGIVGFHSLPDGQGGTLDLGTSIYRTAELFTLNLDVPDGVSPGPALWIAAVLAPLTTARVLFELVRGRLRAVWMRHGLRDHVVVCGAGARGAHLAEQYAGAGSKVVVVDREPQAPAAVDDRFGIWTVIGDARSQAVLRRAGARRAATVIAITGDDTTNAAIASAMRDEDCKGVEVYAHVDDPGLAGLISAPGLTADVKITPFSSAALAAAATVTEASAEIVAECADTALIRPDEHGQPASILICGDDPVVDALILELHRRWQVQRLRPTAASHALRPRIALLSPQASARMSSLRHRYGTVIADLELIAHDIEPEVGVSLDPQVSRLLRNYGRLRQAWVVDRVEVAGLRLAIALSRALGPELSVRLLSEAPTETLTRRVVTAAATDGKVVPRSLVELGAPRAKLGDTQFARRRQRAVGCDEPMAIVDDPMPIARRWEHRVIRGLGVPQPEKLLLEGLRADLLGIRTAKVVGPRLVADPDVSAETAFTYYASVVAAIDHVATLETLMEGLPEAHESTDNVRGLLELKCQVLWSQGRRRATTKPYAIVAGGADTWDADRMRRVHGLLAEALDEPPWRGVLVSGGTPDGVAGVVGALAKLNDETLGFLPETDDGGPVAKHPGYTGGDQIGTGFSVAQPLRAWRTLIDGGIDPSQVPVVIFPGGSITRQELALAHALGAPIGVVDLDGEREDLDLDELPGNGQTTIPLPADAMAIRAFVRDREVSHEIPEAVIERLARTAHERYRRVQRAHKAPDDPATQPWERLSPVFRRSNEAQATHIPAKLARLGYRLAPSGRGKPLDLKLKSDIDLMKPFKNETLEALARMEHGRWIVERARQGWELGERRPHRLTSPYLLAWEDLDDDAKSWDRDVIAQLPALLEDAGLRVERLEKGVRGASS
jgi:voltage-gated potassium channel Kch